LPETVLISTTVTMTMEVPYDLERYCQSADGGCSLMSKEEVIESEKEQAIEVVTMALEEYQAKVGNPNLSVTTTVTFHDTITKADL
jgi:hypothetical protein